LSAQGHAAWILGRFGAGAAFRAGSALWAPPLPWESAGPPSGKGGGIRALTHSPLVPRSIKQFSRVAQPPDKFLAGGTHGRHMLGPLCSGLGIGPPFSRDRFFAPPPMDRQNKTILSERSPQPHCGAKGRQGRRIPKTGVVAGAGTGSEPDRSDRTAGAKKAMGARNPTPQCTMLGIWRAGPRQPKPNCPDEQVPKGGEPRH